MDKKKGGGCRYYIFTHFLMQGDQLIMACFSGTLQKVTWPMYAPVHVHTGQVTFSKVPEKTVMFHWSPCRSTRLVGLVVVKIFLSHLTLGPSTQNIQF